MEARVLCMIGAACAAFAFAGLVSYFGGEALRRRVLARGGGNPLEAIVAWRVRNGFAFANPLADLLLKSNRVRAVAECGVAALSNRGYGSGERALCTVSIVTAACVVAVTVFLSGSVVATGAVLGCMMVAAALAANAFKERRDEAIREAVPAALDSMSVCFGSGFTLLQTFAQVANDIEGPLGNVFARSAHILETGGSAETALEELKEGAHASELAFIAVALDVQHQAGGSMKQVIEAASETVVGELELRRSLRVQTAQAKLSARVVAVMPLVLVAAFSLASPGFLLPFFESVYGYALLGLAVVMMLGGIAMVRHALEVEGVS